MAMAQVFELKHPNGYILGSAVLKDDGWRFFPNISGKHTSRRGYPTADDCLPQWARTYLKKGASFLRKETHPMTQTQPTTTNADAIKAQEERKRRAIRSTLYHLARLAAALHETDCYYDLDSVEAKDEMMRAEKAFADASIVFNRIRG
jgi:hypothetical protein